MFNNVTYNSPLTPSLLTQLSMGNSSTDVVVYGPQAFVLEFNQVCFGCYYHSGSIFELWGYCVVYLMLMLT